MDLSVVTTLYRSAAYVEEFHRRVTAAARALTGNYEIVMVNDGSPDGALAKAVALAKRDPHVVVVDLSRNFGHHQAILAGLAQARGERIFLIDIDLEEKPEWLPLFAARMEKEPCDVVYGIQEKRKGSWFERVSGWCFYKVLNAMVDIPLPESSVMARLMTRRYVDALLSFGEREILLGGLMQLAGFEQHPHAVKKHSHSPTTYTLRRKLAMLVNAVTSLSSLPLVFIFYTGLVILGIAMAFALWFAMEWAFFARPHSGWTSVIISIWLLGGLMISFIGIIGIYLSKVFSETKQRPRAIVREIHGG
ncbi:MAG: glycosyltransferase family 2 protein [Pseudomonadota bacterium]|nr:glycosyltransferase family 2 protein [Pseudomonadota bacterium]